MTWTKLSDDYGDQCSRLSDAAFRTHTEALIWVMRRETDGRVTDRDVERFAETADPAAAAAELVACGYWTRERGGYRVRHHMEHQPESDLIEARRKLTAERVRKHRRKRAGLPPDDADVTPLQNALPGSGRDGTGKTHLGDEQDDDERWLNGGAP